LRHANASHTLDVSASAQCGRGEAVRSAHLQ
jgi:hypothetical protein